MYQKLLSLVVALLCFYVTAMSQHKDFTPVHLTFEKERAVSEDTTFQSLNGIRHETNSRASSGYYSGMLTTLFVGKTQSVPLAVTKGDRLVLEGYAHYEKTGNKKLLRNLALAIAAGVATSQLNKTILKGEEPKIKSAGKAVPIALGAGIGISSLARQLKGRPRSTMRWELYNQARQLVSGGAVSVGRDANANWQHIHQAIEVLDDGYIIIYLSNQSKSPVWFDEVELKKASDNASLPNQNNSSFSKITILSMTNNVDAGCGEDDDDECGCSPTSLDPCPCESDPDDPCENDAFSCECDELYCESGPCDDDPYSCSCDSYASDHPMECSNNDNPCTLCGDGGGGDDNPCGYDPFSCDCNPSYCQSNPCDTNPSSCECNPAFCQPCTSCYCNPAFCQPCTTCDCNSALCPPGNNNPPECDILSAMVTVIGINNAPGNQITITAVPNRIGNPVINTYKFEIFYDGLWYDFEGVPDSNPQKRWETQVLGTMKFRVTIDYTCNGVAKSVVSSVTTYRSDYCHTDLIGNYGATMNTCWTNTVNASQPGAGQHEYGFYVTFVSEANTGGRYVVTDFHATAACGNNVTHNDTQWSAPRRINPFSTDEEWKVGGFHTHPPLTHCAGTSRPNAGPSTIDMANNTDFPRVVRDYCTSPVTDGHDINLPVCDYNYGPSCTTY